MAIEYANSDPIKVTHTKGAMSDGQKYTNTLPWKVELTNDDLAYQEDIQNLQRQINALEADLTWRDPVETYEDLPASGNDDGDVRLVTSTGVLYVWAGSEWVALNESQDPIKELTAADKNYPTDNPNGIAWWLLPAGTYHITDNTPFYYEKGSAGAVKYFTVLGEIDGSRICFEDGSAMRDYNVRSSVHIGWYKRYNADPGIWQVPKTTIVDNLNSTSTTSALSANQGKVLNEKIGDLTTLETTDKTSTVNAINEVLATAGGPKALSSADYNYPTNNPKYIALWLLEPGIYYVPNGVAATPHSGDSNTSLHYGIHFIARSASGAPRIISFDNYAFGVSLSYADVYNVRTNGYCNQYTSLLTQSDVINDLAQTATAKPLSANQGKILNERIGDLTTLTTTDKTSAVAAINEIAANAPAVVQTTGTSTTDVMSQKAVTDNLPTTLTDAQYEALWSTPNALNVYLETIVSGEGV